MCMRLTLGALSFSSLKMSKVRYHIYEGKEIGRKKAFTLYNNTQRFFVSSQVTFENVAIYTCVMM